MPKITNKRTVIANVAPNVSLVSFPDKKWLKTHSKHIICLLSINLKKRKEMLSNAIDYYKTIGAKVLLFVPDEKVKAFNKQIQTKYPDTVRIVSYRVKGKMFVGHSRNAVLLFMHKNKDIFKSCVMADERIYRLVDSPHVMQYKTDAADRFWVLKRYMDGERVQMRGDMYNEMHDSLDYLKQHDIKMLSLTDQPRNRNRKYNDLVARIPIIAQLVIFKIGYDAWHGQEWYPETAMGEDLYFANWWSHNISNVVELRSVAILRATRGHETLTRKHQNLKLYSDSSLNEVVKLFSGKYIVFENNTPMVKWLANSPISSMIHKSGQYAYNEMYNMLYDLYSEWNRRFDKKLPDSIERMKQYVYATDTMIGRKIDRLYKMDNGSFEWFNGTVYDHKYDDLYTVDFNGTKADVKLQNNEKGNLWR
jgi:hypothetical protein